MPELGHPKEITSQAGPSLPMVMPMTPLLSVQVKLQRSPSPPPTLSPSPLPPTHEDTALLLSCIDSGNPTDIYYHSTQGEDSDSSKGTSRSTQEQRSKEETARRSTEALTGSEIKHDLDVTTKSVKFSPEQVEELERGFATDSNPSIQNKQQLAEHGRSRRINVRRKSSLGRFTTDF